jgi:hypothetical protein
VSAFYQWAPIPQLTWRSFIVHVNDCQWYGVHCLKQPILCHYSLQQFLAGEVSLSNRFLTRANLILPGGSLVQPRRAWCQACAPQNFRDGPKFLVASQSRASESSVNHNLLTSCLFAIVDKSKSVVFVSRSTPLSFPVFLSAQIVSPISALPKQSSPHR